jgi:hypothetical protein
MTRPADAYEREVLRSGDPLLYRERSVQKYHWVLLAQVLVGLAFSAVLAVSSASGPMPWFVPALSLLWPGIMGALWLTLSVLRVHLTTKELLVKLGPLGPRVPLEKIVHVKVVPIPWGKYRGGGVRREADGVWTQSFMMNKDRPNMVEVLFDRGDENVRVHLTSEDPEGLVRRIEQARAARLAEGGTRIAASATGSADAEAEAEREAAAEVEAALDQAPARATPLSE